MLSHCYSVYDMLYLLQFFIRGHFCFSLRTHSGHPNSHSELGSMATVNTMAAEVTASELEEDEDLLIEALRRHLTYVEVNTTA